VTPYDSARPTAAIASSVSIASAHERTRRQLFPGDTFEIAKRLKQINAQPDIAGNAAYIARRTPLKKSRSLSVISTPSKMCNGDGFELFARCPAQ